MKPIKNIFIFVCLYILFSSNLGAEIIKLECKEITSSTVKKFNFDTTSMNDYFLDGKKIKTYLVMNLDRIPIVAISIIDLDNLKYYRKAAGKKFKTSDYKKLVKSLKEINKNIPNYQKKEFSGQEMFEVSRFGSIDQEKKKFLIVEDAIKLNQSVNSTNLEFDCVKQ